MPNSEKNFATDCGPHEPRTAFYSAPDEVAALVGAFETCTLPQSRWTHSAHLTVALWFLLSYEEAEATERIREGIQRLNASHGVVTTRERGYHETLTRFWIRMTQTYLNPRRDNENLLELANGLLAAYCDKHLPLTYYSRERLMSWEARSGWLEPDLQPLPE